MANRKISEFTALTAPASNDVLPIIDISESGADKNKKITLSNLLSKAPDGSASAPAFSFNSDTNTGISGGSDTLVLSTGGVGRLTISSAGLVTIPGNLTVGGTTTTIDSTTLTVADKNIEIAKGTGNDAAVDGAGITVDSTEGDKTWNWIDSTDSWTSSEHIDLASGKVLKIAGTQVLSATAYTGNAATATILANARTIGGVSFNGSANIDLPGVNTAGNQNTTGSAATLTTARTIGGVSFDGSANIDLPGVNTAGNQNTTGSAATLTTPRTIAGVSFDGSANISLNNNAITNGAGYIDGSALNANNLSSGTIPDARFPATLPAASGVNLTSLNATNLGSGTVPDARLPATISSDITGNAATATVLATARSINGVSFNGSSAITITAAAGTLTGTTLNSTVVNSSLTSVGTLTGLTVSGDILMSGTGALDVAAGTTAERPGSPNTGMFRYNSTTNQFEGYTNTGWGAIAGGSGVTINNNADNRVITGSGTANTLEGESSFTFDGTKSSSPVVQAANGIIETAATISSNHTVTTNFNAMSAGPVTVSADVTIPSGSVWTIV